MNTLILTLLMVSFLNKWVTLIKVLFSILVFIHRERYFTLLGTTPPVKAIDVYYLSFTFPA